MFNYFADLSLPDRPIVPSPANPRDPVIVEPDYTAINIAIAAMAVAIILIVVFTLLALKNRKKEETNNNDNKKSN